jgi:hypothetical protein
MASVACSSCYKATFQQPTTVAGERHDEWTSFFLWGLVGRERVDAREVCRNEAVAEVRTGSNAGTAVVSLLTLGIYMPRKVYVTCAGTAVSSTEISGGTR